MSNRKRLGDDVIMAYVDGALPEKLSAQVSDFVEQDAASRKRGRALKEIGRLAHAAFQDVLEEPAPLDLKRRLAAAAPPQAVEAPVEEPVDAPVEDPVEENERRHDPFYEEDQAREETLAPVETPAPRESYWSEARPNYRPSASYPKDENRPDKPRLANRQRARKRRAARITQAAAALLLVLASGAAGFWVGGREAGVAAPQAAGPASTGPVFDERILPGMAVFTALENRASGEPVNQGAMTAMARFTYRDGAERICRQYHVAGGARAVIGVACRLPDSRWQPQMTVEGVVQDGQVRTVAGGAAALEAYLVTSMASAALSAEEERQLLQRGW